MKNVFYFMLKAPFVLYIPALTLWLRRKRPDKKGMIDFKYYDITDWTTNNCNTHNAQYLKIWSVNRI